jgi:hypothetical protein
MRKLTSRALAALGIVATLGLSTPVLASAGSTTPGSSTSKSGHETYATYLATRHAIQVAFRTAVNQARTNYQSALASATTSAQRSAARQVYEAGIIQAATTRSAALTALGPAPSKSGSGQNTGR